MYQKKMEDDIRCPLEYGLHVLGGKWKTRVLCLLGHVGPMRFGEVKAELVNISDGVLAVTLNDLIGLELVSKMSEQDSNQTVYYQLTSKGQSVIPLLYDLCRWAGPYYTPGEGIVMKHCLECKLYKTQKME